MDAALIGAIAGLLAFSQAIPYIYGIIRGKTKPERASYGIWSLVNIITLLSYLAAGGLETAGVTAAYTLTTALIFAMSFKYGVGGLNKFDVLCIALAIISILLWVTTANPLTALYLGILVKIFGLLPTLVKAYYRPDTENTLAWVMCAAASTLNLFAITSFTPAIVSLPLYGFIADVSIALLVLFPALRPWKKKFKRQVRFYTRHNFSFR